MLDGISVPHWLQRFDSTSGFDMGRSPGVRSTNLVGTVHEEWSPPINDPGLIQTDAYDDKTHRTVEPDQDWEGVGKPQQYCQRDQHLRNGRARLGTGIAPRIGVSAG